MDRSKKSRLSGSGKGEPLNDQSHSVQLPISGYHRELVSAAAEKLGLTITEFIKQAALSAADHWPECGKERCRVIVPLSRERLNQILTESVRDGVSVACKITEKLEALSSVGESAMHIEVGKCIASQLKAIEVASRSPEAAQAAKDWQDAIRALIDLQPAPGLPWLRQRKTFIDFNSLFDEEGVIGWTPLKRNGFLKSRDVKLFARSVAIRQSRIFRWRFWTYLRARWSRARPIFEREDMT